MLQRAKPKTYKNDRPGLISVQRVPHSSIQPPQKMAENATDIHSLDVPIRSPKYHSLTHHVQVIISWPFTSPARLATRRRRSCGLSGVSFRIVVGREKS